MTCDVCHAPLAIGDFPFCGGRNTHARGTGLPIGDACDVWIRHGLCHDDGSPRHFTSKAEIARVAKAKGYEHRVRHIDGSPHTQRFV